MRIQVLFMILVAMLMMLAADDPKADVKKEYDRFEGTWKIESLIIDGKPLPPETYAEFRMVIKGETFTSTDKEGKTTGTYKVDPSKSPKTIDISFNSGPLDGLTMPGIYELEGDTYRVCLPGGGSKTRPTEFASKPGTGVGLEVLKRIKP